MSNPTFYNGFDADQFPGLKVMQGLRLYTNLRWCGYYLHAPSHADRGWLGQRPALVAQGWGVVPIYVGQQTQGPGSKDFGPDRGEQDGLDAGMSMVQEGFPDGTAVYLDCEEGPGLGDSIDPRRKNYLLDWVEAVENHNFTAGIYCSHLLAAKIADLCPSVRVWATRMLTATHADEVGQFVALDPTQSGYAGACAWQHTDNVTVRIPGFSSLFVDLSSSVAPDPAAPPQTFAGA